MLCEKSLRPFELIIPNPPKCCWNEHCGEGWLIRCGYLYPDPVLSKLPLTIAKDGVQIT